MAYYTSNEEHPIDILNIKEALINSQNRISYEFLSNASS